MKRQILFNIGMLLVVLPPAANAEYVKNGDLSYHRCVFSGQSRENYLQHLSRADRSWLERSTKQLVSFQKSHRSFENKSFYFDVDKNGLITNLTYAFPSDDLPPHWDSMQLQKECHFPTPIPMHKNNQHRQMHVVLKKSPNLTLDFRDN